MYYISQPTGEATGSTTVPTRRLVSAGTHRTVPVHRCAPVPFAFPVSPRPVVEQRDRGLNPPGTSEAELKKRTLTDHHNDRAVLDAYGWRST